MGTKTYSPVDYERPFSEKEVASIQKEIAIFSKSDLPSAIWRAVIWTALFVSTSYGFVYGINFGIRLVLPEAGWALIFVCMITFIPFGIMAFVALKNLAVEVPQMDRGRKRLLAGYENRLNDGIVIVRRFAVTQAIAVYFARNSYPMWLCALGDNHTLLLGYAVGGYIEEERLQEKELWPNSEFEVERARFDNKLMGVKCLGARLTATTPDMKGDRTKAPDEDVLVLDGPVEKWIREYRRPEGQVDEDEDDDYGDGDD